MAVLWALAAMLCVVSACPTVAAQDKDELARRHFESGAAYFAEAEYEEALRAFRKAYELSERPQILLNIAVVEERLGNLDAAVATLDQYMAANPSDPELETIRLRRDNLKKRADEADAEVAPEPAPTPASPPPPAEPAAPPPEPPVTDEPEPSGPNLLPAYISVSVGALAGVGAAITGLGAQAEYDELESNCSPNCSADDTSTGETLALTSTVLTGVAVIGVGLGTYLWLSADDDETSRTAPRVLVGAGPAGGFAQARWRF
jgi:tetratricopeptide (TPR) repeat protein